MGQKVGQERRVAIHANDGGELTRKQEKRPKTHGIPKCPLPRRKELEDCLGALAGRATISSVKIKKPSEWMGKKRRSST